MELLIKNKGIKSSEYCFNKDFFIIILTMLNMCQHSQQSTTISTQVKKTKSKQPNEKTKLKKTTKKINNLLQQLSLLFLKFLYFLFNYFHTVLCFYTFFFSPNLLWTLAISYLSSASLMHSINSLFIISTTLSSCPCFTFSCQYLPQYA